ncbi:M15 family metallopeptidase [Nocardia otitidiscaviarum]|uniref:M15 family metallopeptidase n=1 Tax=Nocardia otitidiscaviarum TaxID=1823 RepID=UPI001895E677|nr:M15 family metallopeptidase [Nocardia otitidiscaviarum]MBF6138122.1 M15 family metallopeptidase [Nocardia otitidiscaviarum]
MGFRTVYGNTHSENGWRMVDRDMCVVALPALGIPFTDTAPLRGGDAATILGAWLIWYHRTVEPLSSPVWGWSPTNDVPDSNHLSGTAVDINAPKYPWQRYTMSPHLITRVRRGLELFEGTVFWGRDWSRPDEMHYQLGYPEGDRRIHAFAERLNDGYLGIYATTPQETDMALTPHQASQLDDIQTQLRGPGLEGWPQLGKNPAGQNLTLVDAVAALRAQVAALESKVAALTEKRST